MSNAIKFTHRGKVTLTVSTKQIKNAGIQNRWLIFSVQDTGIGISEDKHHSIFEAFQQADGSISRKFGGTGLGLSISRDLARLLGDRLNWRALKVKEAPSISISRWTVKK